MKHNFLIIEDKKEVDMDLLQSISREIAALMFRIEVTAEFFRKQNFHRALNGTVEIIDRTGTVIESIMSEPAILELSELQEILPQVIDMLKELSTVQESGDMILLADLLELRVMPWMLEVQGRFLTVLDGVSMLNDELFRKNSKAWYQKLSADQKNVKAISDLYHEVSDKGYSYQNNVRQSGAMGQLEPTGSGMPTLRINSKGKEFYMHSNQYPALEGYELAKSWYKEKCDRYIIVGMGLGYAVSGMLEVDRFVHITVYEYEWSRLMLSFALQDFEKWIESGQLTICYDPDFCQLQLHREKRDSREELVIHYPSLLAISEEKTRESLEDYFIQYSSIQNQTYLLHGNFKKNIAQKDEEVSVLKDEFYGKDLYIVAAGPSLDHNFLELKKVKEGVILATGTVLRKLLNAGIRPNFVIMTDAFDEVYEQIRGLEDCGIPLLYLSTVCAGVPQAYQGKRYIIYQNEFAPAQEAAGEKQAQLYYTGGSVSTTAMELGIVLESKRIIFLGLDLAFTGNMTHASGTPKLAGRKEENLREVPGVNEPFVMTSKNMDSYRQWIERRIIRYQQECREKKQPPVQIIDATEGGARVNGTILMELSKVIEGAETN